MEVQLHTFSYCTEVTYSAGTCWELTT